MVGDGLLPGVRLQPQPDGMQVTGTHLDAPATLADLVELQPDGRFLLCGRQSDLLEIAVLLVDLHRRPDRDLAQLDAEVRCQRLRVVARAR
jgi:hypothetical protein